MYIDLALTRHLEVEPLRGPGVGLDVLAVHRPVQVCDEAGAAGAGSHVLVGLCRRVHIDKVVVGAYGEIAAVRRELHLVENLFAFLDVSHLRE